MTDEKESDDQHMITDEELDTVSAGMKIPNLFSGADKLSFDMTLKTNPNVSTTVTAQSGPDVLGKGLPPLKK